MRPDTTFTAADFSSEYFKPEVLEKIRQKQYLNIWVPASLGGLDLSLTDGIETLYKLAKTDGSLGWFVTLCSGANFFLRNLPQNVAKTLFDQNKTCFGGSGMIGGTAEKQGDSYIINGRWKYATGAPFLTHFTLNAQLSVDGVLQTDSEGQPVFRSFILNAGDVEILETWRTMGLKATASHDFQVSNVLLPAERSFLYNEFYGDDSLDKIPFMIFAGLTLIANYIGIAANFAELALEFKDHPTIRLFAEKVGQKHQRLQQNTNIIESHLNNNIPISEQFIAEFHEESTATVTDLLSGIMQIYPLLGIKAANEDNKLNRCVRDFLTATQHSHFCPK